MEEEQPNPLLSELRQGLGHINPQSPPPTLDKTREEMVKIISELKQKMVEIDKITAQLDEKRRELERNSPKKTEKILQEIKVPPLELLK